MNALTFQIELLEPLLVTQLGSGDENSAESLNYIPGSVLRNALAARYIAQHAVKDAALDETCRKLFFDERVLVLNSYRANHNQERSLPTPLSWYAKKDDLSKWKEDGDALTLYDGAVDDTIFQREPELKPFAKGGGICSLLNGDDDACEVEPVSISHQVSVHIRREHKRELTGKEDSDVFAYQALAAGETFCGAILADDTNALNLFAQMLNEMLVFRIGGSRSAGYGLIRVSVNVKLESNWHETERGENADGKIIVTLLSDVIARDANGQFVDALDDLIGAKQRGKCFRQMKQVGGFNRKWGLPLPQAHAIQAGSVFVYNRNDVNEDVLHRALEYGIGERRQDGFGRIAVNWNTAIELHARRLKTEPIILSPTPLDTESENLARRIIEHQVRKELDVALQRAVLETRFPVTSKSTFARVRLAARQSIFGSKLQPLEKLLEDISTPKPKLAAQKLQESRGRGTNLYAWLQARIHERDVEKQLNLDLQRIPPIGSVRAEMTDALKTEYTARLIEGVMRRAQKEANRD